MISRLIIGGITALTVGYIAGVTQSSFRHYHSRFVTKEDNVQVLPPQEVIVVETKKRGGKR